MANSTKTAPQIKSQITRFSARVSQGLDKPKRRFINEMISGIQASKDVKLSNIARALDEDVTLVKTVGRLSRQITSKDLTHATRKTPHRRREAFHRRRYSTCPGSL